MADKTEDDGVARNSHARRQLLTKLILSCAAIAVAVLHVVFPAWSIDTVALILLAAAAIPWLGELFESIETPAGSIKYRKLEEQIKQLAGAQASTRQIADVNEARDLAEAGGKERSRTTLGGLADEYNRVRREMPSGPARTNAMTTVVGQMIAAIRRGEGVEIEGSLRGSDLGRRLAAYATLYTNPDPDFIIPLVDSIVDIEPKPFGQFWGLRSLARVIETGGMHIVDFNTERRLQDFLKSLPAGTDRSYELGRILDAVRSKSA